MLATQVLSRPSTHITTGHRAKLERIRTFVQDARTRDDIQPTLDKPRELSGIAHGEGFVHLQALIASDYQANWASLTDPICGEGQCDDIIAAFPQCAPRA